MRRPSASERVPPGPGQESVWDYPRPPSCEPVDARITVVVDGVTIVDTTRAWRVCETSHPPTYYLPVDDFVDGVLEPSDRTSFCEWKGAARYVSVRVGDRRERDVGWFYPTPTAPFAAIAGHVALYATRMDECRVDGELVTPQPGGFYGGWVTSKVVGPFKGEPGTEFW